jgi:tRNA pseudouridine38-40 synthase
VSDGSARRLAFTVEYDGTDFHGWAAQPTVEPTLQQTLADAVKAVVGHPVRVDGASRTDAGVHARDQRAAVTVHHPIRPEGLVKAINRRLPPAVAVRDAHEVPLDHQPRFSNGGKTYCYRLRRGPTRRPLTDRYAWLVPWDLDFERILPALPAVLGTRDYASFASQGGSHRTTVRTLWRWSLQPEAHGVWALRVSGTAFMKHMVRNLVGTLVEVARGHWTAADVHRAVVARDRTAAGPTAPACGLTLERIHPLGEGDRPV